MERRKHGQACIPAEEGYYWATDTVNGVRQIVLLGQDGLKHLRVFCCRLSSPKNPNQFADWRGPLEEE